MTQQSGRRGFDITFPLEVSSASLHCIYPQHAPAPAPFLILYSAVCCLRTSSIQAHMPVCLHLSMHASYSIIPYIVKLNCTLCVWLYRGPCNPELQVIYTVKVIDVKKPWGKTLKNMEKINNV